MNKKRILKIYSKLQTKAWNTTAIPEIRLHGKWLKDLGFIKGKEIIIEEQKNKLIIITENEN